MPYFDGARGRVYYRHWEGHSPQAQLVFLHGHGEHSGHYHRFAAALNHRGISVWAADLIGHGLSEGERGVVTSVDDLAANGAQLTLLARESAPRLPIALAGHSLGGAAAAILATGDAEPYVGLVLTGTPLDGLPAVVDPEVSRDAFYLDALEHDPLGFDNPAADVTLSDELLRVAPLLHERLPALDLPVLLINGTEDVFAPPARAAELAQRMPRARAVSYDGAYHDILNDTVHRRVAAEIGDFVLDVR